MDSGPGDEMLLLAVAERDMGAFGMLYERHAGWLAIRLARRCNDRDLVILGTDLTQLTSVDKAMPENPEVIAIEFTGRRDC